MVQTTGRKNTNNKDGMKMSFTKEIGTNGAEERKFRSYTKKVNKLLKQQDKVTTNVTSANELYVQKIQN